MEAATHLTRAGAVNLGIAGLASLIGLTSCSAPTPPPAAPQSRGHLWSTAIYSNQLVKTSLDDGTSETVTVGESPIGVVLHGATNRLFVSMHGTNELWVLDAKTHQVRSKPSVGSKPYWVWPDLSTDRVLVSNSGSASFSIIDPKSMVTEKTLAVEGDPIGFELWEEERALYFADYLQSKVLCVSADTGHTTWKNTSLNGPIWVALEKSSARLFVAESMGNSVAVLDARSGTLLRRFSVGTSPTGLLVSSAAGSLVVLNHVSSTLAFYRLADLTISKELSVGKNPVGGLLSPDGMRLAVSLSGDDAVAVVDLQSFEMTLRLSVGDGPRGLAWSNL